MALNEEGKHDFLLVIVGLLFIMFVTGNVLPPNVPVQPVIVGPA